MAGLGFDVIIAKAIENTFKDKGLMVMVHSQRNFERDQLEFCVTHGSVREYLAIDQIELRDWGGDYNKPLRFTNGRELYLVRKSTKSVANISGPQQPRLACQRS